MSLQDAAPKRELMSDIEGMTNTAPPLSRRGFMTASAAAAAGYTLCAGPVRADVIHTDTNGLTVGEPKIALAAGAARGVLTRPAQAGSGEDAGRAGGVMGGYFARPANVANPPIILVGMEIFGVHEYIRDVVRRLAKLGAFAVAPDYYFRLGDLTKVTEIPKLMPLVNSKKDSELFSDLDAAVQWAKSQGGDTSRLGMMGFCRGGRNTWLYSTHNPNLKAAVAFYGPLADNTSEAMPKNALSLAADVKCPVLGLYGEADTGISVEAVEKMKAALAAAGKTAEFHIYPGAPHGFHADYRPSYRKEAAEDGWNRMTAWFKKYKVLG
jgi:carboxymethylenebutenolidase